MTRLMFLNLPVLDLAASRTFFEELGFGFDRGCQDEHAVSMIVNESAFVVLIQRDHFADFVERPIADAGKETALTIAISADDRQAVDRLADRALDAGATPAKEPLNYGFMYQRTFHDLDGHLWEVLWMDRSPMSPETDDSAGEGSASST